MVIGMRGHDLGKLPLGEFVEKMKELNVRHTQLALTKTLTDLNLSYGNFSHGVANHIGQTLRENNIHVSVLGSYINLANPDAEGRRKEISFFKENLKYAKYIGADMVATETGTYDVNYKQCAFTYEEGAYQLMLATMREIVADAEKLGVMVAVEGVVYHTLYCPEIIKRFIDDINSPNLCIIFDPVNLIDEENYTCQQAMIDKMFRLCGPHIAAIHLKDFKIEDGKRVGAPVGEGIFDFKHLFGHIKKTKPFITMLIEGSSYENFTKEVKFLEKMYDIE